jgi:hypothetical protein
MIYSPSTGMFDQSMATAWSTGRQLALADPTFSSNLLHWRRNMQRTVDLLADRLDAAGMLDETGRLRAGADEELRGLLPRTAIRRRAVAAVVGAFAEQLTPGAALGKKPGTFSHGRSRFAMTPARLRALQQEPAITALLAEQSGLSSSEAPAERLLAEQVLMWLASRALLHGVPFDNLVPHPQMLPNESLRFFYVDLNWIDALLDGCLSVAMQTSRDVELHALLRRDLLRAAERWIGGIRNLHRGRRASLGEAPRRMAGFVLRSSVVSGWPGLEVRAWPAGADVRKDPPLRALRLDRLSDTVLLGIYGDVPATVTFSEPSEGLMMGREEGGIELRYLPGMPIPVGSEVGSLLEPSSSIDPTAYQRSDPPGQGALVVGGPSGLAQAIGKSLGQRGWSGTMSPASFAVEMVQSPQAMIFEHPNPQETR